MDILLHHVSRQTYISFHKYLSRKKSNLGDASTASRKNYGKPRTHTIVQWMISFSRGIIITCILSILAIFSVQAGMASDKETTDQYFWNWCYSICSSGSARSSMEVHIERNPANVFRSSMRSQRKVVEKCSTTTWTVYATMTFEFKHVAFLSVKTWTLLTKGRLYSLVQSF